MSSLQNLTNGANQSVTVVAGNSVGKSAVSNAVSAIPRTAPSAAENVQAKAGMTADNKVKATVTWNVPNTNGDAIKNYKIMWTDDKGVSGEQIFATANAGISGSTGSVIILGLTNGRTYTFSVRAENAAGYGATGTSANAVSTMWDVPARPGNNQASNSDGDAIITWEKPNDNGTPLQKYFVYIYDNAIAADNGDKTGSGVSMRVVEKVEGGEIPLTLTINGLTINKYFFRVAAVNALGEGQMGGPCSVSTIRVPSSPKGIETVAVSDTELIITWQPANENGAPITQYIIKDIKVTGGTVPSEDQIVFTDGKNGVIKQEVKLVGLDPYAEYTVTIVGVNSVGGGLGGESTPTRTLRVPFEPTNVTVEPTGASGELSVAWAPPATYAGTPNINYVVYMQEGQGLRELARVDEQTLTTKLTGLTDGMKYNIIVKPTNKIGVGVGSAAVERTPFCPAHKPTEVVANIKSGTVANLAWKAPLDNGGSAIHGYQITVRDAMGADITGTVTVTYPVNKTETTAVVSGLTKGATYSFVISAVTGIVATGDVLGAVQESNTVVMWADPAAPVNVVAKPTNESGEIRINWEAPMADGDTLDSDLIAENHTAIDGYYIYYKEVGATDWIKTLKLTETGLRTFALGGNGQLHSYVQSGLDNHKSYEFKISAENGAGEGVQTETAATASSRTSPSAPVITTALTGDKVATIGSVTPNVENGGDPVTAYNIYATPATLTNGVFAPDGEPVLKKTINAKDGVAQNNVQVPNLENGKNYMISVRAVNGAGTEGGAVSNGVGVRVGMPLTPTNFKIEPGANLGLQVSYDAAVDHGSKIDYYNVYMKVNADSIYQIVKFEDVKGIITGKENGDVVSMKVSSHNAVGESPLSEEISLIVGGTTTPIMESVTLYNDRVEFNWSDVQTNGNKLQHYLVYLKEQGTADRVVQKITTVTEHKLDSLSTIKVAGDTGIDGEAIKLELGKTYVLQVTGVNMAGESQKSIPYTFTFGVPQAPTITGLAFGAGTLDVKFVAPIENGGSPVTSYSFYVDGVKKATKTIGELTEKDGGFIHTLFDLANGTSYKIQVSAHNQYGEGALSMGESDKPTTTASEPRQVVAKAANATQANLTWKPPAYDGGDDVIDYKITVLDKIGSVVTDNMATVNTSGVTISNAVTDNDGKDFSVTISGLKRGETYSFLVQALTRAAAGAEGKSNVVTTFIEPGQPTIVSLTSGNTNASKLPVTVKWTAPKLDGGTPIIGYDIYSGGVKKNSAPVTETTYTIQEMSRGRNYEITVIAVNLVGSSQPSKGVVIRVGMPPAPVVTSITTGINSAVIKWNAVEGVTQGYRIYEEGSLSPLVSVTKADILEATLDDLQVGATYKLYMTAYNDLGDGSKTEIFSVTIGAPGKTTITKVEPGYKAFTVNWEKPEVSSVDENHQVSGYKIHVEGGESPVDIPIVGADVTSTTVENLVGGKAYSVSILAINGNGDGLVSEPVAVTPWVEPALAGVTDVTPGDGTFKVSFTEPKGNGSPVTGYKIYTARLGGKDASGGDVAAETAFTQVSAGNVTFEGLTATVRGVINGTPGYAFYVAAVTEPTVGKPLESIAPAIGECMTVITGIPGAPVVTSVLPGDGKVTISFTKPVTVGAAIDKYTIRYSNGATEHTRVASDTTAEIPGLSNGVEYTLWVKAHNAIGDGPESEYVKVTVGTPTAPEIRTLVGGNGIADLTWSVPEANGNPIYIYRIYANGEFIKEETQPKSRLSGLDNGGKYLIQVAAVNKIGESTRSEASSVTPGTVPNAPENVAVKVTGQDSIEITWEKPLEDGGLPIANYAVTGAGVLANGSNVSYSGTTATVTGLTGNTEYVFTVKAVNAAGNGATVTTDTVRTFTKPGAPAWDSISSSNKTITAEWHAPVTTGGTAILGYNVYVDGVKNNEEMIPTTAANTDPITGIVKQVIENSKPGTKLEVGVRYRVTITAINTVGEGMASDGLNITVQSPSLPTPPNRPENLQISAGNGELIAKWSPPSYDGLKAVTGYYIFVDGVQKHFVNESTLEYKMTGLTNGRTYEIFVKAVNELGMGIASIAVKGTPKFVAAPGVPEKLNYKNNSTMNLMTIGWSKPAANALDTDIRYNVYVNSVKVATDVVNTDVTMEVVSGTLYNIMVEATNTSGIAVPSGYIRARNNLNVMEDNINVSGSLDENFDGEQDQSTEVKAPQAPADLAVKRNGTDSISLTWVAPVNNGGGEIKSYNVYVNGQVTNVVGGLTHQFVTTAGKTYTVQVAAVNEAGEGKKSETLAVFVSATTAPGNLKATLDKANNNISIEWTAPTGVTVDKYKVYVNGMEITGTEITNTSHQYLASANKEYIIRVSAVVGGEESRQTDYVLVSTMIQYATEPQNLALVQNEGNVELTWTEPATVGDLSHYVLYVNGVAETGTIAKGVTAHTFTTVEEKDYTFQLVSVTAWTEGGTPKTYKSVKSNAVTASTVVPKPDAPTAPVLDPGPTIDTENLTVDINWSGVAVPGGADSIEYYVYLNGVWDEAIETDTFVQLTLLKDTDYIIQVSAVSVTGGNKVEGAKSNAVTVSTKPVVSMPHAPTGLAAKVVKDGDITSIHITWDPKSADSPDFERYDLSLDGTTITIDKGLTTHTLVAVKGKTEYAFCISAVNSAGSAKSEIVNVSTKDEEPAPVPDIAGAPAITGSVSDGKNQVKVSWTKPTENPVGITGYVVSKDKTSVLFAAGTVVLLADGTTITLDAATDTLPENARGVIFADIFDDLVYPIVVTAVKSIPQDDKEPIVWVGTSSNTWNISRNLNVDTDADGDKILNNPDQNLDADGDGNVDVIGKVVKITGTISAGGEASVEADVKLIDRYNHVVATGIVKDGQFVAEFTLSTGGETPIVPPTEKGGTTFASRAGEPAVDTYSLVVTKSKCTSYTITGISIGTDVSEIALGEAKLYAGELNGDDTIDIIDLLALQKSFNQINANYDLNGDGRVDIIDLLALQKNLNKSTVTVTWVK